MSERGEFYYLETNKRIQVEHLISEMVTGVDIVEKQLRMASERRLDLSQEEIEFTGAAMNCRINAEDPARGFIPSPGRVDKFVPPGGPGVRVDSALYDGAFVPEYYDSLVAKVAAQGLDRREVIERMKVALGETVAAPTLNHPNTSPRSPWRSRLEEPQLGRQALYVEGL